MSMDLGADFEKEAIEAFAFWKQKQLEIVTDPKVIDDLNTLVVEVWIKRILRPAVYETLGQKRADIKNPYVLPNASTEIKP